MGKRILLVKYIVPAVLVAVLLIAAIAPAVYAVVSPSLTNNAATYITVCTARLNGYLDDDGDEACEIRFCYDDDAPGAPYTYSTAWVDGYETGDSFYADIGSLSYGTTYYYVAEAKNAAGTTTSSELTFDTLSSVGNPTNVRIVPSTCYIDLSWTKGNGSINTLIRYTTGECPSTNSSGNVAYNGTASSFTHGNLSSGTTYYYQLWGYACGNHSANGSGCFFITTLAGDCGAALTPSDPGTPGGWFAAGNYTKFANWPGYGLINNLADTVGMPYGTAWMMLMIFIDVVAGLLCYAVSRNLALSAIVVLIGLIAGRVVDLLPLWFTAVFGLMAVGIAWKELR